MVSRLRVSSRLLYLPLLPCPPPPPNLSIKHTHSSSTCFSISRAPPQPARVSCSLQALSPATPTQQGKKKRMKRERTRRWLPEPQPSLPPQLPPYLPPPKGVPLFLPCFVRRAHSFLPHPPTHNQKHTHVQCSQGFYRSVCIYLDAPLIFLRYRPPHRCRLSLHRLFRVRVGAGEAAWTRAWVEVCRVKKKKFCVHSRAWQAEGGGGGGLDRRSLVWACGLGWLVVV